MGDQQGPALTKAGGGGGAPLWGQIQLQLQVQLQVNGVHHHARKLQEGMVRQGQGEQRRHRRHKVVA